MKGVLVLVSVVLLAVLLSADASPSTLTHVRARHEKAKRSLFQSRVKAHTRVKGVAPPAPWNDPVYLIGFAGDPSMRGALGVVKNAWWELAYAGHVMVGDGTVAQIAAGTHHAWGYHPPEGVWSRLLNGMHAALVLPWCWRRSTSGIVQDDTHWVTSLSTHASWAEYFNDLKDILKNANRNYFFDPMRNGQGWLFCEKEIKTCGAPCKAKIQQDYANSQGWWNKGFGYGGYGGKWKYSYPTFAECRGAGGNVNAANGGLFTASQAAIAAHDTNNRGANGAWNTANGACMNCCLWPPLVGIDDMMNLPIVRAGKMKDWFEQALGAGFTCGCYVPAAGPAKTAVHPVTHDACRRFRPCYPAVRPVGLLLAEVGEGEAAVEEGAQGEGECLEEECGAEACKGDACIESSFEDPLRK